MRVQFSQCLFNLRYAINFILLSCVYIKGIHLDMKCWRKRILVDLLAGFIIVIAHIIWVMFLLLAHGSSAQNGIYVIRLLESTVMISLGLFGCLILMPCSIKILLSINLLAHISIGIQLAWWIFHWILNLMLLAAFILIL